VSDPIRVALADDHELVLEGLQALLQHEPDIQVVAAVTDGDQLLRVIRCHSPDVVVLDLEMPVRDGFSCLEKIRREKLPVRVLVLTAFGDGESIQKALEYEADGFALKTESPRQTIAAIRQVAAGQFVFPRAARRWLFRQPSTTEVLLSKREQQVLALVAEGLTNTQIAARLMVSENTVKFHLQNIFQKLGVSNRTEAARYYCRRYLPE